jgi:hypothetical protein
MNTPAKLENPGQYDLELLQLVSTRGLVVSLADYMVEFNLYEDIFSPSLMGTIVITDKLNLIEKMPIVGEELLVVKITTPTFPTSIEKTFRVTRISDKHIVQGQNAHFYTLHFVSQELVLDMNAPIYRSFEGNIDDVAVRIFEDYVAMSRTLNEDQKRLVESNEDTPLKILTETKNKVKFVSPGWTAFKCLNWLASKAIPKDGEACNFLFWESNKCFYFASLETIFRDVHREKRFVGTYTFSPNNIRTGPERDTIREMFLTDSVETVQTVDHAKNYTSGYLANRLIELDLVNKKYELVDYDHVYKFYDYHHMSGKTEKEVLPFFALDSMRNAECNIMFYPKHTKHFDSADDNINEVYRDIHGNRKSNLLELDNFKLNINVPGRTDVECGQMIYLKYPAIEPKDTQDKNKEKLDPLYSGAYLITAIRHQFNGIRHKMILELTKDSLSGNL